MQFCLDMRHLESSLQQSYHTTIHPLQCHTFSLLRSRASTVLKIPLRYHPCPHIPPQPQIPPPLTPATTYNRSFHRRFHKALLSQLHPHCALFIGSLRIKLFLTVVPIPFHIAVWRGLQFSQIRLHLITTTLLTVPFAPLRQLIPTRRYTDKTWPLRMYLVRPTFSTCLMFLRRLYLPIAFLKTRWFLVLSTHVSMHMCMCTTLPSILATTPSHSGKNCTNSISCTRCLYESGTSQHQLLIDRTLKLCRLSFRSSRITLDLLLLAAHLVCQGASVPTQWLPRLHNRTYAMLCHFLSPFVTADLSTVSGSKSEWRPSSRRFALSSKSQRFNGELPHSPPLCPHS